MRKVYKCWWWRNGTPYHAFSGEASCMIRGREDGYPASLGLQVEARGLEETSRVRIIMEYIFLFRQTQDLIKEHGVLIFVIQEMGMFLRQLNLSLYSKSIFLLIIFNAFKEKCLL